MSGFPRELLEGIASWAEVLTAAFGILAATSAVVYLLANRPLKKLEAHDTDVLRATVADAQRALLAQQERADLAAAKLAGLEQDAANAKTEMAKQQTIAANAERSLLELQQRVKARHLSKQQFDTIVEALRAAQRGSVEVKSLLMDGEGQTFAKEINQPFHSLAWSRENIEQITLGDNPPSGVVVMCRDGRALPTHFESVFYALDMAKLSPTRGQNPNVAPDAVWIVVGTRP